MKQRVLAPGIPMPPYDDRAEDYPARTRARAENFEPSTEDPGSGSQLLHIEIERIDPNRFAPREVYTPEMILRMANDLRERGQNDPIHVVPHPNIPGRYIIADGWTRVQACRIHGVTDRLWAKIHVGMTEEEAGIFGYRQNEARHAHSDLDRAMFFERLIGAGKGVNELADEFGLTRQAVNLYRAFTKLPEELLDIAREHPDKFGIVAANELLKLVTRVGVNRAVVTAMQFIEEDRSTRWLISRVQALSEPRKKQGPALIRQVRYANGYYRQRGDHFEVSIEVPPEMREAFANQIEAALRAVAKPLDEGEESPLEAQP